MITQRLLDAFDDFLGLHDLLRLADHGVHHLDVVLGAHPQNRAQLGLENGRVGQAIADPAKPEKRVHLGRRAGFAVELVPAQVQGADDDRVRGHGLGHFAVGRELLVLAREILAVQVEELRAEQADPFRVDLFQRRHVVGELDVAGHHHPMAVGRFRRQVAQGRQPFLDRVTFRFELAVDKQCLAGGFDDQRAAVAVEDRLLAVVDVLADIVQADHRRQVQRPRHDRRVRGVTAHVGGKPDHVFAVERGRVRRRQIIRDHDRVRRQVGEQAVFLSHQVAQDPAADVADIRRSFAEIFVRQF